MPSGPRCTACRCAGAPAWLSLTLTALLALLAPLAGARLPGRIAVAVVVAGALAYLGAAQLAFVWNVVIPLVGPMLALVTGAVAFIAWGRLSEGRARLDALHDNEILEARVRERTDELWQTQREIVRRLGRAVDWRDGETGEHVDRIGGFCEQLGLATGMSASEAELLRYAAVLHDVGKVGIPDRILNKPGPLDRDEWEVMKIAHHDRGQHPRGLGVRADASWRGRWRSHTTRPGTAAAIRTG